MTRQRRAEARYRAQRAAEVNRQLEQLLAERAERSETRCSGGRVSRGSHAAKAGHDEVRPARAVWNSAQ